MRLSEALGTNVVHEIGTFHFDAEGIIEFAREFDPHFFHLDPEAARESLFGGLCASGWHVCAAAMKCYVAYLDDCAGKVAAKGEIPPKMGPSPGIRNLRWLKPVFAGDTVTFFMTFLEETPVERRPGRLLDRLYHSGRNQKGETVLEYEASVIEFE